MVQDQRPSELTQSVDRQLRALLGTAPAPGALEKAYRLLAKWRSQIIENTIVQRSGTTIPHGPFAGMDYATRATEGARSARLLGCYEASLAPIIETIVARDYAQIVDIGCAEGYYAVGLARRMPRATVLAHDTNPQAQAACRTLAQQNGVADRVQIGGAWGHADFAICSTAKTAVICDIEGAERDLLDPTKAPGLRHADILVEVHECFHPGLCDQIAHRFAASHRVTQIARRLDPDALPPWMEGLSDLDRLTALWEWRAGPTPWLWLERKDA